MNVYLLTWVGNKKQVITGKSLLLALKRNGYNHNHLYALLKTKVVINDKDKEIKPNKASILYTE